MVFITFEIEKEVKNKIKIIAINTGRTQQEVIFDYVLEGYERDSKKLG